MATLLSAGEPAPAPVKSIVRMDPRSGKLVRKVIRPAASNKAPGGVTPAPFSATVEEAAARHSLPTELIHSVIEAESNYNPYAISPKGARGLMQLIPATARRFGVADVFDPVENIQGGAKYLRYLLDLYGGNYTLALAAYNAGEGAVAKYGDVPPYEETRKYVEKVGAKLETANKPAQAPPEAAPPDPDAPRHILEILEPDGSVRYVSQ